MKRIRLFLTGLLLVMTANLFAQNLQVTGTVTDASTGDPIPFASVQVKGTMVGTATDDNGKYSISVSANGVLIFSSVGYTNVETQVMNRTVINAALPVDAIALEDVILVAYGTAKKSSFTGSAVSVSGDKIKKTQVSNISKALEGAVPGLQTASSSGTPGSGASIIIRGLGSISASQSPLIVVDGVPYEGSLNSIPTQDIENLTVLKDAAANSMYGARGSNGVILIQTRQAKTDVIQVSFEARAGVNTRGVPAYNIITNPAEYYEMMYESIRNSLTEGGGMSLMQANLFTADKLISNYLKYNIYKGVADNALIDPYTGKINPNAKTLKWTDNWSTDPFHNGIRQEYNLNILGGTEKTKAYASVSYLGDDGYVSNSGFNRIAARVKIDQTVNKFIKAGVNLAYSNTEQQTFGSASSNYSNIFMFSQSIGPIYPIYLYDADGLPLKDVNGKTRYDYGTEYNRPYAQEQNPLSSLINGERKYVRDNISSRAYVDFNIMKDLKFTVNMAYDVFLDTNTEFTTPVGGDAKGVGGRGYKTSSRYAALNANQLLSYSPTFGDHSISLLLGHENKRDNSNYLMGHMTNFVDIYNPEFANATLYQDLTSNTSEYALEGYFGRAEYSYKDRYYLSGSYRMDASSRFAPDVRWGSFWSVGASWRVTGEDFLKGSNIINNLKLKASYGTQGNDNIGMSKVYLDLYTISRVNGKAGVSKSFRGNPAVTWEKSTNMNVGIEAGFWNRVNIAADFFIKKTTDMIYYRPLPPSEGSPSSKIVNDIDMKNTGVEFEISVDAVKTRDIRWNISFNGTTYKNELTKLPSDKDPKGYQAGSYWRKLGGSLYDYYTYQWAGVNEENGKPQYKKYVKDAEGKETGEIELVNKTSDATLKEVGKSSIPKLYGGITTTLDAFGVDLSISGAYQYGGYVWDSFYSSLMNPGDAGNNMHTDMFNRWTVNNKKTDVPRLLYQDRDANASCDKWLVTASYFSLRNVTLGYTIPSKLTNKVDIQRVRIYLSGDNLWLKSARKGLDPRQSFDGGTGYVYSALSTYSVGLNIVF